MKKIFAIVCLGLVMNGCQNISETKIDEVKSKVDQNNESAITGHGEPFSKGPSGPPAVKGPSSPPPQAQAVTKNENIRLTLPLKSN